MMEHIRTGKDYGRDVLAVCALAAASAERDWIGIYCPLSLSKDDGPPEPVDVLRLCHTGAFMSFISSDRSIVPNFLFMRSTMDPWSQMGKVVGETVV